MVDTPAPDEDAPGTTDAPPEPAPTRHGVPSAPAPGTEVLHPSREQLADVVGKLYDEGYLMCIDLTAVDYFSFGRHAIAEGDIVTRPRTLPGDLAPERFEVVYHFLRHEDHARVRLRVQVPESDPVVGSLFDRYPGTEAMEREVFDMFGITFEGHPDLTRILMPEDWHGHPLRKDYAVGSIPVQFKQVGDR